MATFKGKSGIEGKHEVVFHNGHTVATIKGTLETSDPKVIDVLTTLGYERVDTPPLAQTLPLGDVLPPDLAGLVDEPAPVSARAKRKLGGKH